MSAAAGPWVRTGLKVDLWVFRVVTDTSSFRGAVEVKPFPEWVQERERELLGPVDSQ